MIIIIREFSSMHLHVLELAIAKNMKFQTRGNNQIDIKLGGNHYAHNNICLKPKFKSKRIIYPKNIDHLLTCQIPAQPEAYKNDKVGGESQRDSLQQEVN